MPHLWLLLLILNAASSQYTVKVEPNKSDMKEGDDLLLTWTVGEDDGWTLLTKLNVKIDDNVIAEATTDGLITVTKIEEYFGKRVTIDNADKDNRKYVMKISNLNVTDSYTLKGTILSRNSKLPAAQQYKDASAQITLDVNVATSPKKGDEPTSSNTGTIVGAVVGVLALIVLVIVVFVLYKRCYRRNHTTNPTAELKNTHREEPNYGHYAPSTVVPKGSPTEDRTPSKQIYSELGTGGGRDGPRPTPHASEYSEVRTDARGYPARGPAANDDHLDPSDSVIV